MTEEKIHIGIDIDGTITATKESLKFFQLFTSLLKPQAIIHIITNRDPKSRLKIVQELQSINISYDYLEITTNKKDYILDHNISIFFDNTDEYYLELPSSVIVFKIREDGNFDFDKHKWIYGDATGINIDSKK